MITVLLASDPKMSSTDPHTTPDKRDPKKPGPFGEVFSADFEEAFSADIELDGYIETFVGKISGDPHFRTLLAETLKHFILLPSLFLLVVASNSASTFLDPSKGYFDAIDYYLLKALGTIFCFFAAYTVAVTLFGAAWRITRRVRQKMKRPLD